MPFRRVNSIWTPGFGWQLRKVSRDADYSNMGDGWPYFIAFCRWFPDFLADVFWSDSAPYELAFLQRMFLRIDANYRDTDIFASRGTTKSFCNNLGKYLKSMVWPRVEIGIFGPNFRQMAAIAKKIHREIERCAPMLTESMILTNLSADRFNITTVFGSSVSIEAFRGNTMHEVTSEETAQEGKLRFDDVEFTESVLPQVRADYKVNGFRDPTYIPYQQHSITSAGRRQNYSYEIRKKHFVNMIRGDSSFVIDVPYQASVLCKIRTVEWAEKQRGEMTAAAFRREMLSIASGTDKDPMIADEQLGEARCLMVMEDHHCCKDRYNKLRPDEVIYVLSYDVSYREGKGNAKCACVVGKLTRQKGMQRDKYLKQIVWIEDWTPGETKTPMEQAIRLRKVWNRFSYPGSKTYIVVDSWQFGDGVVTSLMADPPGGGVPLCCYKHCDHTDIELEGALPVIYPIKASVVGAKDPDADMILNAQMNFEFGNVQLLTQDMAAGVEKYKDYHRIRTDDYDFKICMPYKKTNELITQIQNLRATAETGVNLKESRLSRYIQRDSWSALKYLLRFAQILERATLVKKPQSEGDWGKIFNQFRKQQAAQGSGSRGAALRATTRLARGRAAGRRPV